VVSDSKRTGATQVETYSPDDLREKYKKTKWISPYQKIVAVHDEKLGQIEVH
jgi:hypothetical protein